MEGVTQGDPLSMILYIIGMLPLTRLLKRDVPGCNQPWYTDDAGAASSFDDIIPFLKLLSTKGAARGYFPEPMKSIFVVKPESVERATARFAPLGFRYPQAPDISADSSA